VSPVEIEIGTVAGGPTDRSGLDFDFDSDTDFDEFGSSV
jgi:hypothetical protein